jgi:hypothetical protein
MSARTQGLLALTICALMVLWAAPNDAVIYASFTVALVACVSFCVSIGRDT